MRCVVPMLVLSVLCAAEVGPAHASSQVTTTSEILCDIKKVKAEKDIKARAILADEMLADLYKVRSAHAMNKIDDRVVDELIVLLDNDSDIVRGSAAAGIGYFGTRARRAVPALHDALARLVEERKKRGDVLALGLDSAGAIEAALQRVQGVPDGEIFHDTSPSEP